MGQGGCRRGEPSSHKRNHSCCRPETTFSTLPCVIQSPGEVPDNAPSVEHEEPIERLLVEYDVKAGVYGVPQTTCPGKQ